MACNNNKLRKEGKAYPRTCQICGLYGPCKEQSSIDISLGDVIDEVQKEVQYATSNWPPFNSAHEGWAVLYEEVDELWDEVKLNESKRDLNNMRTEAIQVAATAIKFILSICNEESIRK